MTDLVESTTRPAARPGVLVGPVKTFNPDAAFESGVLRSAAAGAVVGFLLFTVFVGLLGKWTGLDDSGALFLGMFTGLWGGLGFGMMVGSVLAATRGEDREPESPPNEAEPT